MAGVDVSGSNGGRNKADYPTFDGLENVAPVCRRYRCNRAENSNQSNCGVTAMRMPAPIISNMPLDFSRIDLIF